VSAGGGAGRQPVATWDPQAFVERLAAGWQLGEVEAFVAHFEAMMDPRVISRQPLARQEVGFAAFERRFRATYALLPGMTAKVLSWGAREPNVYVEWEVSAPGARGSLALRSCDRFTLRDGLIVERAIHFDPSVILAFVALRPGRWPALVNAMLNRP
jgi:hypothetical protein